MSGTTLRALHVTFLNTQVRIPEYASVAAYVEDAVRRTREREFATTVQQHQPSDGGVFALSMKVEKEKGF